VEYQNKLRDLSSMPQCTVTVFAKDGRKVTSVTGISGKIHIPKANFWWPYLTNPSPGYLYTLEVSSFISPPYILLRHGCGYHQYNTYAAMHVSNSK
jgi:hypothetical protein